MYVSFRPAQPYTELIPTNTNIHISTILALSVGGTVSHSFSLLELYHGPIPLQTYLSVNAQLSPCLHCVRTLHKPQWQHVITTLVSEARQDPWGSCHHKTKVRSYTSVYTNVCMLPKCVKVLWSILMLMCWGHSGNTSTYKIIHLVVSFHSPSYSSYPTLEHKTLVSVHASGVNWSITM